MIVIYPALIHREDGAYWVDFPDLEGCQSFGDTLAETIQGAKEALAGYCIALLEQNRKLPAPTDIDKLITEADECIAVIEASLNDKSKSVKKTLTLPAWLNTVAEDAHLNFSQVLQKGLKRELNIE